SLGRNREARENVGIQVVRLCTSISRICFAQAPSPSPQPPPLGRGGPFPSRSCIPSVWKTPERRLRGSLSPRERVGVRGKGAFDNTLGSIFQGFPMKSQAGENKMPTKSAIAIAAHPDDIEFYMAGTLL